MFSMQRCRSMLTSFIAPVGDSMFLVHPRMALCYSKGKNCPRLMSSVRSALSPRRNAARSPTFGLQYRECNALLVNCERSHEPFTRYVASPPTRFRKGTDIPN